MGRNNFKAAPLHGPVLERAGGSSSLLQLNSAVSDTFICVPEMGSYATLYAKTQLPSDPYDAAVGPWQARYGHNSTGGS